ncbi:TPA: hypothetical protein TZW92_001847 [Streptococcus suis]|nr:hypothetical protein [Streptococcus suis]
MDKMQVDLFVVRIIGYDPKKRRYCYPEKEFPSEYEAIQFMKKLKLQKGERVERFQKTIYQT